MENIYVATSLKNGIGKTTISKYLALSLSKINQKTLLIDSGNNKESFQQLTRTMIPNEIFEMIKTSSTRGNDSLVNLTPSLSVSASSYIKHTLLENYDDFQNVVIDSESGFRIYEQLEKMNLRANIVYLIVSDGTMPADESAYRTAQQIAGNSYQYIINNAFGMVKDETKRLPAIVEFPYDSDYEELTNMSTKLLEKSDTLVSQLQ